MYLNLVARGRMSRVTFGNLGIELVGAGHGEYGATAGLYESYVHCIILIPKIKQPRIYIFNVVVLGEATITVQIGAS